MRSTAFIPIAVFILTLALLAWGYVRSRKFGKLGLLSWLQFVALMSPWLIYFGLFVSGLFINFTTLLFLLLGSTIAYVAIGNQLRKVSVAERAKIEAKIKQGLGNLGEKLNSNNPDANNANNANDVNTKADDDNLNKTPIALAMSQGKLQQAKQFSTLPMEDLKLIQGIFGIETFYVTETIPYQEGVIFKGNLRGEPAFAHERLTKEMQSRIGDKYNLFLVEGQDRRPVVIVLPTRISNFDDSTIPQKILIAVLILANAYTALNLGAMVSGIPVVQS